LQKLALLSTMFQVTFSEQAISELNKLDKLAQLEAVEPISGIKAADLEKPREPLGRFHRGGQTLYRLRSGDHRFYFDIQGTTLFVHYILHRNSLEDFLLRNKLPVTETQLVEQHSKFWKYLESLTKKTG
jgi:mRNA interferase RelE/StbE